MQKLYTHWHEINRLIDRALEVDKAHRKAFLKEHCLDNPEIFEEAVEYLRFIEEAETEGFLEQHFSSGSNLFQQFKEYAKGLDPLSDIIGLTIGPYEITGFLGEGGMGSVYKAKRVDGKFEQQVAVKFLKSGLYSPFARRRFDQEKTILSKLNHPNIARILDSGLAPNGSPYIVMEYIDGVPAHTYSQEQKLSIEDRLQLFLQICNTVQFAHSSFIIHRDLKPQNIYVTDDGTVKIMDFGIAKILSDHLDESSTVVTRQGFPVASVAYAAPEQFSTHEYSTSTDVYGLGVFLHLLLTGSTPFSFEDCSLVEIESMICNREPEKPLYSYNGKALDSDLAAIILRCLRKKPEERYPTALELANDIKRYLRKQPVEASVNAFGYRTIKFFQRNSNRILAGTVAGILLTIFLIYHLKQMNNQIEETAIQAETAEAVTDFMINLFDSSDPVKNVDGQLMASDLLEIDIGQIDAMNATPYTKFKLLESVARANKNVGEFRRAEMIFLNADSIVQNHLPERPYLHSYSHLRLGQLYNTTQNYHASLQYLQRAKSYLAKRKLDYPEEYAELMLSIGLSKLQIDEVDSAITHIQESIRFYDTIERLDFETMLNAKNTLAMAKKASGETSAAITLYENILLGIRTLDTPSFKLHTAVLNNLAAIYKDEKNYEKADSLYRNSFEIHENVYGREHPQSIMLLQNIRNVAVNRDRIDQADSLSASIIELKRGVYGAQSWQLAQSYNTYGTIQFIFGNFNVATEYVEQAHDIYSNVLGENHNWTINSRLLLAFCLINIQEKRKAKSYYESAASRIQNQIDSYDYFSRQHLQNNLSYALEHSQEDVSDLVEPVKKILDETASI